MDSVNKDKGKKSRSRSRSKEKERQRDSGKAKEEERRKRFGITEEETKGGNSHGDKRNHSSNYRQNDNRGDNSRGYRNDRSNDRYNRNDRNDRGNYDRNRHHGSGRDRGGDIRYYNISEAEAKKLENIQLGDVLIREFRADPKAGQDFKFKLEFDTKHPGGNPLLGNLDEINELKMKITPIAREWDERAKFLISEYELIDTSRPRFLADERYNCPIIRYNTKIDSRDGRDLTTEQDFLYPVWSRAYFKLWEVLSEGKVLEKFKGKPLCIANVAEGPGGFIQALIDFRKRQHNDMKWKSDSYSAITLRIGSNRTAVSALDWDYPKAKTYFDMLKDNGYKIKLSYGAGDGDLYKTKNIDHFADEDLGKKKCELVTADGGIGLQGDEEFSAQEMANAKLFFAEIITTFSVQEVEGTFVMKIYDFYSTIGLQLLAILCGHYEKVRIIKPLTSRPANSEKYLICEGFKGITNEKLNELKETLTMWGESQGKMEYLKNDLFLTNLSNYELTSDSILVQDLREFNELVNLSQKPIIEKGLELINKKQLNDSDLIQEYKSKQKRFGELWCEKHGAPYIKNLKLSKLKDINLTKL